MIQTPNERLLNDYKLKMDGMKERIAYFFETYDEFKMQGKMRWDFLNVLKQ